MGILCHEVTRFMDLEVSSLLHLLTLVNGIVPGLFVIRKSRLQRPLNPLYTPFTFIPTFLCQSS